MCINSLFYYRDLKNELHRLGRSCSPIRYHSEASPGRKIPLKSQNGRSVSPYMSAPKTPKTPEERYSSAKRAPVIEKSEKKRQESPKLKIKEKSKEKEEVNSPGKRNQ